MTFPFQKMFCETPFNLVTEKEVEGEHKID